MAPTYSICRSLVTTKEIAMNIMLKLTCALCVAALASCSGGGTVAGSGFPTARIGEFYRTAPDWSMERPSMTATYRGDWWVVPGQVPVDVTGRFSAVYDSLDQTIRLSGLSASNRAVSFPTIRLSVDDRGQFSYNYRGGACTDRGNGCLAGGFTGQSEQGMSGFGESYTALTRSFVKYLFRGNR